MNASQWSIMRYNVHNASHRTQICLENMGTTMRDYDMEPGARQMFKLVRHDLEYLLASLEDMKTMIKREETEDETEETAEK